MKGLANFLCIQQASTLLGKKNWLSGDSLEDRITTSFNFLTENYLPQEEEETQRDQWPHLDKVETRPLKKFAAGNFLNLSYLDHLISYSFGET